jgi:hypothetical protein
MKRFLLSIIFVLIGSFIFAIPVSESTARFVAANFYRIQQGKLPELALAEKKLSFDGLHSIYYVFQVGSGDGFVIVSGDDQVMPILGYSTQGRYVKENQAPQVVAWLDKYFREVNFVIDHNLPADATIAEAWAKYNNLHTTSEVSRSSVGPLVLLGWDQAPYYNQLCPFDNQANDRAVTGCVATAMAQIMRYWSHPAQGTGFHSYNHPRYGTLSANFGSTTYNWANMPAFLAGNNTDVATLMYHCGVSVDMGYGVASTGGSSAYVVSDLAQGQACAEYSYKTYFGYDPATVDGIVRQTMSDQQWISRLKAELDANRPLQYAGIGSGGGHTWVCDGYDNNNFMHMNWGWSNQNDGFFSVDALNPQSLGAGGGSGGFNSSQQAVIGIKPANGGTVQPSTLAMNDQVFVNPLPIDFALPFTVTTNLKNGGTTSFSGDIAAALFTLDGLFIDFIQTYTNQILAAGASSGTATFNSTGLLATPGNYALTFLYKTAGGNWQLIPPGNYANPVSVTIAGPYNPLKLSKAMELTPSTFVAGQAASVNVNIRNDGSSTFIGSYSCNLYDLQGNFAATINTLNENNGLPFGYQYLSPFLTFSTNNLNVQPGTYILAMTGKATGDVDYLLGGDLFPNPITVKVVSPPPSPDQYEVNNTLQTAYNLPVNFSGNSATVRTPGSNFHVGSDNDYYKIVLTGGYDYVLQPRLHDSYASGNGQTYTVDAVFTMDGGAGESPTIDDVLSQPIQFIGGGTLTFKVAPYFTGQTGTYLLDVPITRVPPGTASLNELDQDDIAIFPNPANGIVSIKSDKLFDAPLELYTVLGEKIQTYNIERNSKTHQINVTGISAGIYYLKGLAGGKQFLKSIAIQP